MAKHENFYENLPEAQMRLRGTVVLYDKTPVYVWAVTDHKGDGVFRIYISPIEDVHNSPGGNPIHDVSQNNPQLGVAFDEWMEQPKVKSSKNFRIQRKKMNSPLFNKFRPFPLGMMNGETQAVYVERQPQRPKTEQGLTPNSLFSTPVTAAQGNGPRHSVDIYKKNFRDCIVGEYPSPKTVLAGLQSPKVANESVAFDRKFALVRGPIDTLFLGYKEDIIGVLPNGDFSALKLGKDFTHCKEVVEELNLFYTVK